MRRKLLLAVACAAAFSIGNAFEAQADGIPVFDASNLAEWVTSIATQAKQYVLQAQSYITQGEQYYVEAQQLLAFVHNPNLGGAIGLLNAAGLGSSLPVNPQAVASLVNSFNGNPASLNGIQGIVASLSGLANGAYTRNHVYSPTDGSWNSQQLIANANNIAGAQGAYQAAYADLKTHANTLQALRDHLATATTPKDVQDTQAQIELETTWVANENAQLAALKASFDTQSASAAQRDNEALTQSIDTFVQQANALSWN